VGRNSGDGYVRESNYNGAIY
jgi:hypothetical protein